MPRLLLEMTDEEVVEVAVDPNNPLRGFALIVVEGRRDAYLSNLDPSAFEGTPEDGPSCPKAPIEWAVAHAHCVRTDRIIERELKEAHERFPWTFQYPRAALMDVVFRIAREADLCSPLYVRRVAGKLGLAPAPEFWEEQAIHYRMDAEYYQRALAEANG